MPTILRIMLAALAVAATTTAAPAQDRDAKLRADREAFGLLGDWVYNDLDAGLRRAVDEGKPLLVVFRCIPCEACQQFDVDVARRDPAIRDLLDRFVCVRMIQANALDLARFRHDFDMSFAAYLMHPDGTIYGRFGTRSDRPEPQDITLAGLRAALAEALRMHADHDAVRPSLAGKQPRPTAARTPLDLPGLDRFAPTLDPARPAASCVHCHMVGEAERLAAREAGGPMPEAVLFPYPDPSVVGLTMDPKACATVSAVVPGSPAERAGLRPGDAIATLDGQPLLSTADLQWVLHHAPEVAHLAARVRREGAERDATLDLPRGWRRGTIAWRASTWELRRMALGGLFLEDVPDDRRAALGLAADAMALRVVHAGEYAPHDAALRAGVRKGDVVVACDGLDRRLDESGLLAHLLRAHRPGDRVELVVLRDGERIALAFAQQ